MQAYALHLGGALNTAVLPHGDKQIPKDYKSNTAWPTTGKAERTIRRELRVGWYCTSLEIYPLSNGTNNADYAQNDAERKSLGKGPELKLGKDWALVRQVSNLVKEHHYSPYRSSSTFRPQDGQYDQDLREDTL